ncbi:TPA: DUF3102 domain-containing protein [Staphylococcus aureus]|uniref:DUF3102 domain-containing protein n=1 Tax=Staphylococcus TaxID=1279 RepID=UPI000AD5F956|nr:MULTISPECIES: DUF3102 domain-containing protein [Staphylococcus]MDG6600802.1 DUF3102 domain-containing protein [Staphylococcus aureus]MDG6616984.1 DUF3102 domain-containing protein [Staphylococcus aureus]MDG6622319.1 DUF3102 domain-containing protein [Staphylococcus aureus]
MFGEENIEALRHLAHGEFVKIYEELPLNAYTYTHLGINAMELITTLPELERTKEHKKASRYYK